MKARLLSIFLILLVLFVALDIDTVCAEECVCSAGYEKHGARCCPIGERGCRNGMACTVIPTPTPTETPIPPPQPMETPTPSPVETSTPEPQAVPLFPMQLLIKHNPPEGWLPFCMVMTEGGVAGYRQPAICMWTADNHPCGGTVYDDGTEEGYWACDSYGYERRPIVVLKCLWQRHLNNQRDIQSFRKCQALDN